MEQRSKPIVRACSCNYGGFPPLLPIDVQIGMPFSPEDFMQKTRREGTLHIRGALRQFA